VVLVNVGDVALAFCWLRDGWSAGAGMGTAGYSPGVLVTILLLAIGHRGGGRFGEREGAVVGNKQATWEWLAAEWILCLWETRCPGHVT